MLLTATALIIMAVMISTLIAFGSGPPYGEATQLYTANVAGAGLETELLAVQSAERAKKRYIQGITMLGANLQELRITGPPATFNGESLHFLGKRDLRQQHVRYDWPLQMVLPDEEDLRMFAIQNAVGAEDDFAFLHYTYAPVPWKPIGYWYSQISNATIVGSNVAQDLVSKKTAALGQGNQTLVGMQLTGEGQVTQSVNVRSSLWGQVQEDEFQANNAPVAFGANNNFDADGIQLMGGNWVLSDSRLHIPSVIGDAGDIRHVMYWRTDQLPASAVV